MGNHGAEHIEGVFQCDGIDDQLGAEGFNLFEGGEAEGVVHEAQAAGIYVVNSRFVIETEQVDKERTHLACSKDENSHGVGD